MSYRRSLLIGLSLCIFSAVIGPVAHAQSDGKRGHIVFMIGEDEYRTWETLPKFATTELETSGYRCSVIMANPPDSADFQGIETALRDADCLVLSVRRRLPPKAQLDAVRAYLASGRPLVGIRTASHAFAPRKNGTVPDGHGAWLNFDAEVLGGNYQNHYKAGPLTTITASVAKPHPILEGVTLEGWTTKASLYRNTPLQPTAETLLMGSIPDQKPEPLAWVHTFGKSKVFYTSLGYVDDFENASFRRLFKNAITWAAGK